MELKDNVRAFLWKGKGKKNLFILDQLLLPDREKWIRCRNHKEVARCIKNMNVRGAPAIGCVAAYGLALASLEKNFTVPQECAAYLENALKVLAATRPTAVNLFWALERMKRTFQKTLSDNQGNKDQMQETKKALEEEAEKITREDLAANFKMGQLGSDLFPNDSVILTHCNTGSLATSGWGTALGVIRTAYGKGKIKKVFVDETRPYLQGARLTAWELKKDKIPYELITDNMAAHFMKSESVHAVIVGSDRISLKGDVANKIGTYALAVSCRYHNIPFYVAAPTSTIDPKIISGEDIPIEERSVREVTHIQDGPIAPRGAVARHPAFDVTPNELVTAIITENGIACPPTKESIQNLLNHSSPALI